MKVLRKVKALAFESMLHKIVTAQGSAEAICASLDGMSSEVVSVKAIPAGLGPISMADIDMAIGMGGTVLGFNVKASNSAVTAQAKQRGVPIIRNNVIYHVIQEVRPKSKKRGDLTKATPS